jgi:hypothetical protein
MRQFKFQPEKIQVGMVDHYVKSSIDCSWLARIFIRVEDEQHLSALKRIGRDSAQTGLNRGS